MRDATVTTAQYPFEVVQGLAYLRGQPIAFRASDNVPIGTLRKIPGCARALPQDQWLDMYCSVVLH